MPLWKRNDGRDGAASWVANRQHPAIAGMLAGHRSDGDVDRFLRLVEDALPAHDIHLHISNDLPIDEPEVPSYMELRALAERMIAAFADQPALVRSLLSHLTVTDPFNRDPDAARQIAEELAL